MARNKTGQAGIEACSGHTPEQTCLGESQLVWPKPSHKVVQLAIRSSKLQLFAWTFFLQKHAYTENYMNFSKTASNSLYHSRLNIRHMPSPHKTTALVCQKCGHRHAALAECPQGNYCPVNVPPNRKRTQQGQKTLSIEILLPLLIFKDLKSNHLFLKFLLVQKEIFKQV